MNNHVDVDKLVNAPILFHLQHEEFGFPEGLHQVGDRCVPTVSFASLFTMSKMKIISVVKLSWHTRFMTKLGPF